MPTTKAAISLVKRFAVAVFGAATILGFGAVTAHAADASSAASAGASSTVVQMALHASPPQINGRTIP